MPKGKQQHRVTKMACTKKLSGAGKLLYAGVAGDALCRTGGAAGTWRTVGAASFAGANKRSFCTTSCCKFCARCWPHFQQNLLLSLFSVPQLGQNILASF
jgi:hypothetical protein